MVRPVAEMMKSASTFSPVFISILVSVNVSICPVTMVALPSLLEKRVELFEVSAPDWLKEVSPRSQTEPLLPRVVGRGEVLVELLLRHHTLHLIEHPFLDQPLGALWIPEMIFKNVSQMVLVYESQVPQPN